METNNFIMKSANFIIYKGHKISRTKALNNISKILNQSTEIERQNNWYKDAYKVGTKFSVHLNYNICENIAKSCGVIAALSPIKSWDENVEIAENFILTGRAKHTQVMTQKAIDILNSDGKDETILSILNGKKISSFYDNIKNYKTSQKVTIDRHALSCIFGRWSTDEFYQGMTKNQYDFFESCFQYAAEKLGYQPSQLQAITWCSWRRIKNSYPRITKKGLKLTDNQKQISSHYGVNKVNNPDEIIVPF
jgi:hypothetical protein